MTIHASDLHPDAHRVAEQEAVTPRRGGVYSRAFKRVADILLVMISAPVVLPVIGIAALVVARDGHNPFYRQERLGLGGRVFGMWKLRTMVPDADEALQTLLRCDAELAAEWHATQKLKNDPRVTPVGKVLRKLSLDELPQVWNVLKGDMSLVGPRPMMPAQQTLYPGQAYFRMRPGITGLWQVSDRNESEFSARARFDDLYERTMSLGTDIGVLARTVVVVMRGTGY